MVDAKVIKDKLDGYTKITIGLTIIYIVLDIIICYLNPTFKNFTFSIINIIIQIVIIHALRHRKVEILNSLLFFFYMNSLIKCGDYVVVVIQYFNFYSGILCIKSFKHKLEYVIACGFDIVVFLIYVIFIYKVIKFLSKDEVKNSINNNNGPENVV